MNDDCPQYKENELLKGQPIGMYHCPYCGEMILAGVDSRPLCEYKPIPPAVTLYWQEERIKELEAEVKRLDADAACEKAEKESLRTLLAACQKALKEMQAQRDKAQEDYQRMVRRELHGVMKKT